MPEDDDTCQTIDCDGLNTSCLEYQDVTTKRCGSLGTCKAPNTSATCTVVTNMCPADASTNDASTDSGPPPAGGGGGGCGCDLGGGSPGSLAGLLLVAGVLSARRRGGRKR
jgi:MYXO-CTERM domain-containing protein